MDVKIAVAVKIAASLDDGATLHDGAVDPADLEWDVNEWDLYAVEAAIQLKEAAGEGEVVLVSVGGGEQISEGMLSCLAMGADRGIHVEVDDEAGALDSVAVARLLAAVIGPESPDIVLSGVQSSDFASAATGTALAALLGLARVAVVRAVRLDDRALEVDRELEGGLVQRLRVELPVALTVQTGINEPRYATLRSIRQAAGKPRDTITPEQLGFVQPASLAAARMGPMTEPPVRGSAEMLQGSASEVADAIATIVRARVS
jgi:electron transfer flavoprotein beta subunit